MEIKQWKPSLAQRIREWLLAKLDAVDVDFHRQRSAGERAEGFNEGVVFGERKAKVKFAVLPLPFTESQLLGREYGEFITPVSFGIDSFGECNIPAPGPHGYEQRAYYVGKYELENRPSATDLRCHHASKFADPQNSDDLVPVIVTVLR